MVIYYRTYSIIYGSSTFSAKPAKFEWLTAKVSGWHFSPTLNWPRHKLFLISSRIHNCLRNLLGVTFFAAEMSENRPIGGIMFVGAGPWSRKRCLSAKNAEFMTLLGLMPDLEREINLFWLMVLHQIKQTVPCTDQTEADGKVLFVGQSKWVLKKQLIICLNASQLPGIHMLHQNVCHVDHIW